MGRTKPVKVSPHWTRRIRLWLDRGQDEDRRWYRKAHRWCVKQAKNADLDTARVVAILAAMSPGTSWERNKVETEGLIRGTITEFTTYPNNVEKARKILDTSERRCYLDLVQPKLTSGWKIGSFYRNIADPAKSQDVTIDRHAIAICLGHAPNEREQRISAWQYRCYAEAYRIVARERGMLPHEVQAVTWAEYRRTNGDLHQEKLPF